MLRRFFCKIALLVLVVCGLLAFSGVLFAQGRSEDALARAIEVQERNTSRLMAIDGVVGTAVGLDSAGRARVDVLLARPGVGGIPQVLEGVSVHPVITGEIYALEKPSGKPGGGKPSGSSIDPTARFERPVPIGVSTGNVGECSAGTIGCRVTDGEYVYALSNNHVYALENSAAFGSDVLQPGRYDTNCSIDSSNLLGMLYDYVPISFTANNTVDAAIALSTTDDLDNATPSDGYLKPSSTTKVASLGQAVQKYGRTTGLTKGSVVDINATVRVGYSAGTAVFVKQIVVYGSKGPFIKAGDSGSLLVTNDGNKSPVGLLFAGDSSGKYGLANQIDDVLDAFRLGNTINETATHITIDGN